MATKSNFPNPSAAAAADEGDPQNPATPTPTVTFHQQLANDFMKELDDIARIVPKIEATRAFSADFVRSFRSVPLPFLATAVTSVEQTPDLQKVEQLDAVNGRDTLQFLEAFRPVLDKLTLIQKSLKSNMDMRQALLAESALNVYSFAKSYRRDESNTALALVVANLSRDLKRSSRAKTNAALRKAAAAKDVTPDGGKLAA